MRLGLQPQGHPMKTQLEARNRPFIHGKPVEKHPYSPTRSIIYTIYRLCVYIYHVYNNIKAPCSTKRG